ncbi:hypothetical protein [Nannocystis bainbridge]|uniref:Uncharacterized protein n=1 Tax=Nannocystis bainbridge TaxID=2995303 RepID=A0ABT5E2A7_9BACT|nr:hypothetical protein [Nannocystis bainbridge]MDC0719088.1 hypothetical protein [Nannocystis bainbridge]
MLYVGIALAVAVLLGLIALSSRKSADRSPPDADEAPARPTPVKQPKRHLIVNPTTSFESLAASLARTGFKILEEKSGEPTSASWDAGAGVVHYTYEPELGLRKLEIEAPVDACASILDDIVNGNAYVSTISYQLGDMLDPAKPAKELLFAIRGAGWIGRGDDHCYYWQKVGKLREHSDPQVAAEARRVYDALVAEAGGKPIPAGPATLYITWTRSGADYVAKFRGNKWVYKPDGTVLLDGQPLDEKILEWPARWSRA